MPSDQERLELENKLLRQLLDDAHEHVRGDANNTNDPEAVALVQKLDSLFYDDADLFDVMADDDAVRAFDRKSDVPLTARPEMRVGDLASAIGLDLNDPAVLAEVQAIAGGPKKPEFVPTTDTQRLAYLVEECGEVLIPLQTVIGRVLQQVGKVLRFGWNNHHHLRPDVTNAMQLAKELEDLRAAVDLLRNKLWPIPDGTYKVTNMRVRSSDGLDVTFDENGQRVVNNTVMHGGSAVDPGAFCGVATHDMPLWCKHGRLAEDGHESCDRSKQCDEEAGHGAHRCVLAVHGPEIEHVWDFEKERK